MKRRCALSSLAGITAVLGIIPITAPAQTNAIPLVRIAELTIDPARLDAYKALLAEEQEASIRLEPGVLMLHSVSLAEPPTHIRLLEVYADKAAYEAHLRSPHFLKYKMGTAKMVQSLTLRETVPIRLCSKEQGSSGSRCAGWDGKQ